MDSFFILFQVDLVNLIIFLISNYSRKNATTDCSQMASTSFCKSRQTLFEIFHCFSVLYEKNPFQLLTEPFPFPLTVGVIFKHFLR